MTIRHLGEQASGMLTERATIREAGDLVASGKVDLVISPWRHGAEDLLQVADLYREVRVYREQISHRHAIAQS
jgi:hypothetical protein